MKELELTLRVRNNRLKERRDALGMTQVEIARAAHALDTRANPWIG